MFGRGQSRGFVHSTSSSPSSTNNSNILGSQPKPSSRGFDAPPKKWPGGGPYNNPFAVPPKPVQESGRGRGYDPPPKRRPGGGPYSNPLALAPPVNTSGSRSFCGFGKRRMRDEDDYFDEDADGNDQMYQPAPGSPSADRSGGGDGCANDDDDDDDPLDAYMSGIEAEVTRLNEARLQSDKPEEKTNKGIRDDIEQADEMEDYLRFMKENPNVGVEDDSEPVYEYDDEGNIVSTGGDRRIIDPLPSIDHSTIDYQPFERNFYSEHPDISVLSHDQVYDLRRKLGIRCSGVQIPKPVCSFGHFGFDEALMSSIRKAGYSQPTPIQSQGIPVALSGRDIIGVAKTGSGKTAAYLWPLLIHIMDQAELKPGDGPIGLICAPTRELSQQIYHEARRFGKVYNINVVCAYGGGSMWEQQKACESGCEILVCTPGRLIDLVKKKSTNLERVTFVVFDEADKMFNMGFEPQVRSIANHIRPDRQTLLFSATFKRKVEKLARDILTDPCKVVQGELGEANEDITQIVEIFPKQDDKLPWLLRRLVKFTTFGSVLIFVTRKANSEEVAQRLRTNDFHIGLIHGDMHQSERNDVISAFKKNETPILVATDVAARGLDIPTIRTVVNFDVARDIDTHTHRIGRTGRAGQKGTAYTLMTNKDKDFAGHLVRNLEGANQMVSPALLEIAMQNPWFKKTRFKGGSGKSLHGRSLGIRSRPGLGASESDGGPDLIPTAPTVGPMGASRPMDRVSAMKAAFSAQYQRMFVSAGVDGGIRESMAPPAPVVDSSMPPPPVAPPSGDQAAGKKRKRPSRWD